VQKQYNGLRNGFGPNKKDIFIKEVCFSHPWFAFFTPCAALCVCETIVPDSKENNFTIRCHPRTPSSSSTHTFYETFHSSDSTSSCINGFVFQNVFQKVQFSSPIFVYWMSQSCSIYAYSITYLGFTIIFFRLLHSLPSIYLLWYFIYKCFIYDCSYFQFQITIPCRIQTLFSYYHWSKNGIIYCLISFIILFIPFNHYVIFYFNPSFNLCSSYLGKNWDSWSFFQQMEKRIC
jgi:hypothetical protein